MQLFPEAIPVLRTLEDCGVQVDLAGSSRQTGKVVSPSSSLMPPTAGAPDAGTREAASSPLGLHAGTADAILTQTHAPGARLRKDEFEQPHASTELTHLGPEREAPPHEASVTILVKPVDVSPAAARRADLTAQPPQGLTPKQCEACIALRARRRGMCAMHRALHERSADAAAAPKPDAEPTAEPRDLPAAHVRAHEPAASGMRTPAIEVCTAIRTRRSSLEDAPRAHAEAAAPADVGADGDESGDSADASSEGAASAAQSDASVTDDDDGPRPDRELPPEQCKMCTVLRARRKGMCPAHRAQLSSAARRGAHRPAAATIQKPDETESADEFQPADVPPPQTCNREVTSRECAQECTAPGLSSAAAGLRASARAAEGGRSPGSPKHADGQDLEGAEDGYGHSSGDDDDLSSAGEEGAGALGAAAPGTLALSGPLRTRSGRLTTAAAGTQRPPMSLEMPTLVTLAEAPFELPQDVHADAAKGRRVLAEQAERELQDEIVAGVSCFWREGDDAFVLDERQTFVETTCDICARTIGANEHWTQCFDCLDFDMCDDCSPSTVHDRTHVLRRRPPMRSMQAEGEGEGEGAEPRGASWSEADDLALLNAVAKEGLHWGSVGLFINRSEELCAQRFLQLAESAGDGTGAELANGGAHLHKRPLDDSFFSPKYKRPAAAAPPQNAELRLLIELDLNESGVSPVALSARARSDAATRKIQDVKHVIGRLRTAGGAAALGVTPVRGAPAPGTAAPKAHHGVQERRHGTSAPKRAIDKKKKKHKKKKSDKREPSKKTGRRTKKHDRRAHKSAGPRISALSLSPPR